MISWLRRARINLYKDLDNPRKLVAETTSSSGVIFSPTVRYLGRDHLLRSQIKVEWKYEVKIC
jgi:hypothetical protein